MGQLTDAMTRLRGEVDASRNMRGVFIDDLKANVTEMQSGFRNNHAEMAGKMRGDLVTFVSDLENSVGEMMDDIRDAHKKMASEQRETLDANEAQRKREAQDDYERRRSEIAERVQNLGETMANFRNNHAEMARNLKDSLGAFVSGVKDDVIAMKAGFNEDHAKMAQKLRDDLVTFVSDLENSVGEMMDDIRDAHEKMASEQRETLDANEAQRKREAQDDYEERRAEIAERQKTVLGLRQEVAADITGARRAWLGPLPAEPKVIKEEFRTAEVPQRQENKDEAEEAESLEAEEAGTAEEVIPDDFTVITGIGPTRQSQLNEAGYYTFAQLAGSTQQKLQEILGESSRSAIVENWVKDARDLAE